MERKRKKKRWRPLAIAVAAVRPALVVNEKVVSMGKVLKAADVEILLHKSGF